MSREELLIRIRQQDEDWLGIALSAAAGLAAGLVAGLVLGDQVGEVNSDRVRQAVRRLRPGDRSEALEDPELVERAIEEALDEHPAAEHMRVSVRALGDGIVELTGTAPDATARALATDLARGVAGADVVVNRILVEGNDVPRQPSTPPNAS